VSDLTNDYADGGAVQAAIKSAAQRDARAQTVGVSDLIRQATFDRFLCRVFSEEPPKFVLKGGTGMLARVATGRATRDIDLSAGVVDLDAAIKDLIAAASVDLGDHFRFVFSSRTDQLQGDNQPDTRGARIGFDVYVGVSKRESLSIDVAVGHEPTGPLLRRGPANRLDLSRLQTFDYVLYPTVDQIADKLCATIATYGEKAAPSSRVKDLVDLVTIALTEYVDGSQLKVAIVTECMRRNLEVPLKFGIPTGWATRYSRLARRVEPLADFHEVNDAEMRVAEMLDPVLSQSVNSGTWDPAAGKWI
jgi:hypothetical protein